MPKRSKKATKLLNTTASTERLRNALAKRRKAELVEVIVEIAKANRGQPGEPHSAAIPMPAGEATVTEGILDGQEVDETAVQVMGMLDQVTSMINEDPEGVAAMVERWVQRNG